MRVLAVAHRFPPVRSAGAETHLAELLAALAAAGHDVVMLASWWDGEPYRHRGVEVISAGQADVASYFPWADVAVTQLQCTPAVMALGKLNRVPVVVVHHNTFDVSKEALVSPRGRVDLVAANSEWVAADLAGWFSRAGGQPATIVARPIPAEPPIRADGPRDRVTLVNLRRRDSRDPADARLTKGGELFRALAEGLPGIGFLAVRGNYGTQQDMSGLDNVDVVGPVDHDQMAAEVWARTKVLLVPSNYESWGRVAVEAMAHGIPVVAADTPGLRECLGPDRALLPVDDVGQWRWAVEALMGNEWLWQMEADRSSCRWMELAELGRADLTRWVAAVECLAPGEALCGTS